MSRGRRDTRNSREGDFDRERHGHSSARRRASRSRSLGTRNGSDQRYLDYGKAFGNVTWDSWKGGPPQNMRKLKMMERTGAFANRDEEIRRRQELKKIPSIGNSACEQLGMPSLSAAQRSELVEILKNLTGNALAVRQAMCWCLDHAASAIDVARTVVESLMDSRLAIKQRVIRLFLLSDVLHNSGSVLQKAAACYRREFEAYLPPVIEKLHIGYKREPSRLEASGLAKQVLSVFRSWEDRAVFGPEFVRGLEATFFRDVIPVDALTCSKDLKANVLLKLKEWEGYHLSQLEKLARFRGLNWQTTHLEQSIHDRPLEQIRRSWLVDRLVMYELYTDESCRLEKQHDRGTATLPSEIDSDIDGDPLSEDDMAYCEGYAD